MGKSQRVGAQATSSAEEECADFLASAPWVSRNCGRTGDIPFFGGEVWKDAGCWDDEDAARDESTSREIFATFRAKVLKDSRFTPIKCPKKFLRVFHTLIGHVVAGLNVGKNPPMLIWARLGCYRASGRRYMAYLDKHDGFGRPIHVAEC